MDVSTSTSPVSPSLQRRPPTKAETREETIASSDHSPKPSVEGPDSLLREETLFQAWKASLATGTSATNKIVPCIVLVCVVGYGLFVHAQTSESLAQLASWVDIAIGYATTMLGFLVAGFAIFSALNRPQMFGVMARYADDTVPTMNILKGIFLRLLRVFAEYWAFLVTSYILKLLLVKGGIIENLLAHIPGMQSREVVATVLCAGFAMFFAYILLLLQSFIFNVHRFVMLGVVWDIKLEQKNQSK